jgi:hypothetical protein
MGAALTAFALLGTIVLARRNLALAAAVAVPFVAALAASLLGKYPLAHRTTTFLLPALWLSAIVGVVSLVTQFPGRRLVVVLPLVLLGPDLANGVKDALRPTPTGTREAFTQVREARVSGDAVWVGNVEVYRTYYGREENVYGAFDDPWRVLESTRTGRIWVVVYPSPLPTPADEMTAALKLAGYREVERSAYRGVVVSLHSR